MIIAVPKQVTEWAQMYGGTGPTPPPYLSTTTWWTWFCTDCRITSKPTNMWSWFTGALESGERHEVKAQCQRVGQLELFAVGGAR